MNNRFEEKVLFESRKDLVDFIFLHVRNIMNDSENAHGEYTVQHIMETCWKISNRHAYLSFALLGMKRSSELLAIVMNAYREITGEDCPISGRYPSDWGNM